MGQDVEKGRRTEIEFYERLHRRAGTESRVFPTPINAAIVQVVKEVQSGERSPGPENVRRVLELAGFA